LTIIFGLIIFFANAQLTTDYLEKSYKQNSSEELRLVFKEIAVQTDSIRIKNENDTTALISQLFTEILRDNSVNYDTNYFFLQKDLLSIKIGNKMYPISEPFCPYVDFEKLIPLRFSIENIYSINTFLGPNPNSSKTKKWTAQKNLRKYEKRTRFLGQFLFLPATWNKLDRSLVPFKIDYIHFNESLKEVEISYNLPSSGAIEIYKYEAGNWHKMKTLMRSID